MSTDINTNATHSDQPDASGWSASLYNKSVPFVYSPAFTAPVLELLAAQPGERIIDFGCGSGEVTLELQKIVSSASGGVVVGVDFSESMIAQAKRNGVQHAFVSDIQALKLPKNEIFSQADQKFDTVFSNAALHWCKRDPSGVLESAKRVLKPGGRIVAEMGGFMNCIGVRGALYRALRSRGYDPVSRDPWYFPSMEDYVKVGSDFRDSENDVDDARPPVAGKGRIHADTPIPHAAGYATTDRLSRMASGLRA
ncbi:hypothetical protein D9615_002818 [Tricholomella constricta]|uniref:Methyltransferase domain-containing protein n=1 Tax=Tricholomella constricta TaxID=117010 RepID=A0A8H5HG84_9AGAR|nr:hypothetical protein D9615_002818 [Tricholomella constricta]